MELSRGELAQDGIAVSIDLAPSLPEVAADEGQLRQALINLVRNAREAILDRDGKGDARPNLGKRIELMARAEGGRVLLQVRDSGPGIGDADLGKIFDPFFTTKVRGTGLGLALVQQVVVDHGGQIDVESAPGQGTTFTMSFPAVSVAPGRAGVAQNGSSLASRLPVDLGPAPVAEGVVERGEREVKGRGVGGGEEEGPLEGGGGGGGLARRGEGAA